MALRRARGARQGRNSTWLGCGVRSACEVSLGLAAHSWPGVRSVVEARGIEAEGIHACLLGCATLGSELGDIAVVVDKHSRHSKLVAFTTRIEILRISLGDLRKVTVNSTPTDISTPCLV